MLAKFQRTWKIIRSLQQTYYSNLAYTILNITRCGLQYSRLSLVSTSTSWKLADVEIPATNLVISDSEYTFAFGSYDKETISNYKLQKNLQTNKSEMAFGQTTLFFWIFAQIFFCWIIYQFRYGICISGEFRGSWLVFFEHNFSFVTFLNYLKSNT